MENGSRIRPISLGIVSADNRAFYAQFVQADYKYANQFVTDKVIPNLTHCPNGFSKHVHPSRWCYHPLCPWRSNDEIRLELLKFLGEGPNEMWAYYRDYDVVALFQLFGEMMNRPAQIPMKMYDLRQFLDFSGHADVTQPEDGDAHNALFDATWVMDTLWKYSPERLIQYKITRD